MKRQLLCGLPAFLECFVIFINGGKFPFKEGNKEMLPERHFQST